jgi:hypothetical protein
MDEIDLSSGSWDMIIMAKLSNQHPPTDDCSDMECEICSFRDCLFHDIMYYHHDRCTTCS